MISKSFALLFFFTMLCTSTNADEFAVPEGLKTEVEFWKNIYSKYTTDQAVLHDPNNLGKIYGVIGLPHCNEPPSKSCLETREDAIRAEKERLGFDSRAQVGQRDKFLTGLENAKIYIPKIEKIFEQYGIPKNLSRLPFVESMFNTKAKSHAGASGIWQIMPRTGRILGLKVSKKFDERNDPIKATHGAAKHLQRDYNRLGSWPLAVNAYNTGPGRLADAVNTLGTKDIVKIIKNYYNPSYGFASRNFYPEFLAALEVYENRDIYFNAPSGLSDGSDLGVRRKTSEEQDR